MKDLADEYSAAIERAAGELAADHADISIRHATALDAAAAAAKAAIDATAEEGRAALARYRDAAEQAHRTMISAMTIRAREFMGEPAKQEKQEENDPPSKPETSREPAADPETDEPAEGEPASGAPAPQADAA